MFDTFYIGPKPAPGMPCHAVWVESIEQARSLSRTRFFWLCHYLVDYTAWDWLWEPPPWQAHQCHVWPSQHQKDSGTYLVPKAPHKDINYHQERWLRRLPDTQCWQVPDWIDPDSVDFSWHPDPLDPPYIYHFASQWQSASGVEYRVPGAVDIKLVSSLTVQSVPRRDAWEIPDWIDPDSIDFTWHPNVLDPPANYHFAVCWGWDRVGGPVYSMPDTAEWVYLDTLTIKTRRDTSRWTIPDWIDPDSVDFTWHPNPSLHL